MAALPPSPGCSFSSCSKRQLLQYLHATRQRLQRLHVCAQWATKAKAVNTCREVLKAAADHGAAFVHAGGCWAEQPAQTAMLAAGARHLHCSTFQRVAAAVAVARVCWCMHPLAVAFILPVPVMCLRPIDALSPAALLLQPMSSSASVRSFASHGLPSLMSAQQCTSCRQVGKWVLH